MAAWILSIAFCIILSVFASFYFIKARRLSDYKELFEISDEECKTSQKKIQDLLEEINNKNLILERGHHAIKLSNDRMKILDSIIKALDEKLKLSQKQYNQLLGQKKSSEVRTGKIAEQISPFLSDYPKDPNTARFIGDPIDFIHFDDNQITFVEVKSGKSQLSKKQRNIRDLIKEGKVEFIIYRVSGEDSGTNKS